MKIIVGLRCGKTLRMQKWIEEVTRNRDTVATALETETGKTGTSAAVPGQLRPGRGVVPALRMEEHRKPMRLAPVFRRSGQKKGDHT